MFGDEHEGPELHIPAEALRKPKGAAVADDGTVVCISCGQRFPMSAVDIVGQGYRCAPCGHQAHVASLERGANVDAGAHLSKGARADLKQQAKTLMAGGICLLALGVIILIALFDTSLGMKGGGLLIAAGVGMMITSTMKKQAAGG